MARLLLLFLVIPLVELALLIEIGRRIGTAATIGIIVVTGVLGAFLARRQGLGVLRRAREEMAAGRLPVGPLADGVMILFAGAVLLTPGLLTDVLGFLCLVPQTRAWIRARLWKRLERWIRDGTVRVHFEARGSARPGSWSEPTSGPRQLLEDDVEER